MQQIHLNKSIHVIAQLRHRGSVTLIVASDGSSNKEEKSSKGGSKKWICNKKESSKEGYNVIEDVGKSTSDQYSAMKKHIEIMFTRHCKDY